MVVSTEMVQRWGGGGHGVPLTLQEFLADRGMGGVEPRPAVDLAQVPVRAARIPAEEFAALDCEVDTDDLLRLRCSGGFSFIDLCHRRWPAQQVPAVDAVVLPRDHDQVRQVLDLASGEGLGSRSLRRWYERGRRGRRHRSSDHRGGALGDERRAAPRRGVRRGARAGGDHRSGTRAVARSAWIHVGSRARSRGSGRPSGDMRRRARPVRRPRVTAVLMPRSPSCGSQLRVATSTLGRAPGTAAGPDLQELFLGSEGSFGIITEVGLRVRPLPEKKVYEGLLFPTFAAGKRAFRELAQDRANAGCHAAVRRRRERGQPGDERPGRARRSGPSTATRHCARSPAGAWPSSAGRGPADVVTARRGHAHKVFRRSGRGAGHRGRAVLGEEPVRRAVPARRPARRRVPRGDPRDRQ